MSEINCEETGKRIRRFMEQNQLSVNALQNACNCSHQAVYNWLSGKSIPSVDNLAILSNLFGVSVNIILGLE